LSEEKEKGFAIWLTGIPASGKSTIAAALKQKLKALGIDVQVLESDELRKVLTPEPTYRDKERENFYNVIAFIGKLLVDNGVNVIFDATANKRRYRDKARAQIERFLEVYIKCPTEVCAKRDPKGLYKEAKSEKITTLPGIQTGYEPPENPDVTILSDRESPEEATEKIIKKLF
jgi:adenylylsulfate kinase